MDISDYRKKLKNKLIEYRYSLSLPKNVTFGIEIEYENVEKELIDYYLDHEINKNIGKASWTNKSEFDIIDYNKFGVEMNGEISSPILRDSKKTWEDLEKVLELLDYKGAIVTNKCGGHVNVGLHVLNGKQDYIDNLIMLWYLYSKEIYKFSTGEFKKIRYNADYSAQKISTSIENLFNYNIDYQFYDKSHDVWLNRNFSNRVLTDNRVEFRIPNGTLNPVIWQNYINFFTRFVLACKKDLDKDKMLYNIKHKKSNMMDLINLVFDNEIDKESFIIQAEKTNKVYAKKMPEHITYD